MPNYDYKCNDCGHEQEEFHSMNGPDYVITCNECGSENLNKLLSMPYVQFIGQDWDTNKNRGIQ